jgi:hypothetical protein
MITGPVTSCIGIDSGKTVGMGFLDYANRQLVGISLIQVDYISAPVVLEAMLGRYYADPEHVPLRFAGVEAFLAGRSAGSKGPYAELTRQVVFDMSQILQSWGYHVSKRPAAEVKTWATNKRLESIGFAERSSMTDMNHAWDGGRHALFTAKHDAHLPDPLR